VLHRWLHVKLNEEAENMWLQTAELTPSEHLIRHCLKQTMPATGLGAAGADNATNYDFERRMSFNLQDVMLADIGAV